MYMLFDRICTLKHKYFLLLMKKLKHENTIALIKLYLFHEVNKDSSYNAINKINIFIENHLKLYIFFYKVFNQKQENVRYHILKNYIITDHRKFLDIDKESTITSDPIYINNLKNITIEYDNIKSFPSNLSSYKYYYVCGVKSFYKDLDFEQSKLFYI